MKKQLLTLLSLLVLSFASVAQQNISGNVIDANTNQPVEGASVLLMPSNKLFITDARGRFSFKGIFDINETATFNSIGYTEVVYTMAELSKNSLVSIRTKSINLQDVVITNNTSNQYKPISKTDIAMRGVNNSQEVLRIIPGIVIGQHQGGGKAEQIFLRGFDADHGTDFRLDVDGMPINMPSHAHGQGFADSHFIIPETIESVDFKKGPYTASKGDYCTTGFVDFNTKNTLPNNIVKAELGMFNTYRALGMVNLLTNKPKQQSWYMASEYRHSDAYFDNPQHFKRFNLFTKYTGRLTSHSYITASATTFWSKWNASGQIPDRAVDKGLIGFYGAIDPFEGGITYRTNANIALTTTLNNGGLIKNQLYYSNYNFDLHTNFTFFLVDTINGDEIRQKEARDMAGYNGCYTQTSFIGNVKVATEAGINVRADFTHNTGLSHTVDRYTTLNQIKLGDITELNIAPYISETFSITKSLSLNAGLRFDQFYHQYNNKLASDTTLTGIGIYKANAHTVSPKLSLFYQINNNLQFYITSGRGFHSNDTRAVVVTNGYEILPKADGVDVGTMYKPFKSLLLNAAVWYIYLGQEFVYGGDGGDVTFTGKTKRIGFDLTARYQPILSLYIDVDVNYAHGRAVDAAKGQDYIPLAPVWTSTGGITYLTKKGFNGSLRYRYVGDRAGNEDYSLNAVGYFITDVVINHTKKKFEFGIVINNILDTRWKETQFDTETRLKGESFSVNDMCFTPGTPFSLKTSLQYRF